MEEDISSLSVGLANRCWQKDLGDLGWAVVEKLTVPEKMINYSSLGICIVHIL